MNHNALLELEDVTIQYETGDGMVTAVSNASFTIDEGEYFGLVGESGCGKSTIAQAILGVLDENGTITSGSIRYKGQELQNMTQSKLNQEIRWTEIAYIPQTSMNSLDPLERIEDQAKEIATVHNVSTTKAINKLKELFEVMGLDSNRIKEYPHQFSGGMQQRAIIALSLFLSPSLIIADEPTTALDVIMQDQTFKYLDKIREEYNTSMMLITHDISLVFESCHKMAIMHGGQIAELGRTDDIFNSPYHPYTVLLQEAYPDHRYPNKELTEIDGDPPQSIGEVNRCTFSHRCPLAVGECDQTSPPQEHVEGNSEHQVACIMKDQVPELYNQSQEQMSPNESINADGGKR